jgi:hypothetical protein
MSAAPERREPIDIDEFERRLRGPEPVRRAEDPLAELARLVGSQNQPASDPFAELFADNGRRAAPPVAPPAAPPFAPHIVPPPVEAAAPQPDPFADFPDLRPLLRGADHGPALAPAPSAAEAHDFAPAPEVEPYPENLGPSSQYEDWAEAPELAPDAPAPEQPRERSKKPLYVAAAVIAAGFVAIGSTLAWRGGAHQAGGVATIAASPNPTKVQPKEGEGVEKASRESTMLERTAAPPVKKVVTRDEQPMDVSAAAKTPRIIPLEDSAGPSTGAAASGSSGAASVPAVAPPAPSSREPAQKSAFPEPKRVKTVSVRADGSIITGGDAAASAPAAAPKPPERTTPAPARNATPKSATRADATSSAAAAPKPAAPKPAAPKPKVEAKPEPKPAAKPRVAAVQPKEDAPAAAAEASDDDEAPKPASAGGYAVQVASAGSESEARQTAARLGDKLSGALGGRRPSVVKASDSLYRVRVTGLSKESANAMCGKVKAAGGACFVAR